MTNSLTAEDKMAGVVEPRYKRIEADLRERIGRGEWAQGVMLPGRRTLAEEYNVDLMTLQRAIARLLDDETLVASGRRGTFVNRTAHTGGTNGAAFHAGSVALSFKEAPGAETQPAAARESKVLRVAVLGSGVADYAQLHPVAVFFMYTFLRSFEEALRQESDVDFVFADRRKRPLEEALGELDVDDLDALVAILTDRDEDIAALTRLTLSSGLPVLLIASRPVNIPIPVVYYDNFSAGFEVGRHLMQNGVKELTVLAPYSDSWVEDRLAGLASALEHGGLPASAMQVFPIAEPKPLAGDDQVDVAKALGAELFASGTARGTIVSINDFTSLGLLRAAGEASLQAGKDFRLISFDDTPQASVEGISSMRPPLESMGREGARILMRMVSGDADAPQIRLQSRLVVRGSSRFSAAASGDSSLEAK